MTPVSAGAIEGSVTLNRVCSMLAPEMRDASSSDWSRFWKAPTRSRYVNGEKPRPDSMISPVHDSTLNGLPCTPNQCCSATFSSPVCSLASMIQPKP